ncbi:MAG: T9SS type A sorting domain-containing protein [Bacteroidetes bacterium]|nr:T9SS type A sorting domain-containing protein [Bacteroidota bacterium]
MKLFHFIFLCFFFPNFAFSQSKPNPLRADIKINRIMTLRDGAVKIDRDPITGNFYYLNTKGNIYQIVIPTSGTPYDTLAYTKADDSIDYAQHILFSGKILYVSGNITPYKPLTTGIIRRGVLQTNGTRVWTTVMKTEPYKVADYFDHLFSGMVLSPNSDSITICSGARGDHGEIESRYGWYPTTRNQPLTSMLFRVPTNGYTYLKNDSAWLYKSGYLYADGIRNTFSMAYDANGNLFGLDNSDSRDDAEEMNWLRRGKHYGFPYKMGDNFNPQQYSTFNPKTDKLINHYAKAYREHYWNNDPTFPPMPAFKFESPIQNIGPDCDKFRDSATGKVMDASELKTTIGTFTAHRSPLGLVFDNKKVLNSDFKGDAFMLSWTKGYMDSCGCTATPDTQSGPFVDPSEDLVHLHLMYDSINQKYTLSATRIVADFVNPVGAFIDSNKIYVIENGYGNSPGLFEVILPTTNSAIAEEFTTIKCTVNPNPAKDFVYLNYSLSSTVNSTLSLFDVNGKCILKQENSVENIGAHQITISTKTFPAGVYYYELKTYHQRGVGKIAVVK